MFLFGMKVMSDGLQKSAGERMRKTLNFMTGNRFIGILTGFIATAIIQSSSAFSVIVVSFVNAGLVTLTQSIGVIFGMNIGTTLTGWIISIIGFKIHIDSFALPAIGIGFIVSIIKWKYRSVGDFLLGFGFLFLGLFFLTDGMANVNDVIDFHAVGAMGGNRTIAVLVGLGVGFVMTLIINSSTASITLIMALAFQDIITYEMAAGMVLGANIGTTLDAPLASIAGNTESRRTAAAHVLFSVIGAVWATPLLIPLLKFLSVVLPGDPWASNEAIPLHLAGLHTAFNIITTLIFLPFVKQYVKLLTLIIPDKKTDEKAPAGPYKFAYVSSGSVDSPELNIVRAEKEISDMAGIVSLMFSRFTAVLQSMHEKEGNYEEAAASLYEELTKKEEYIDQMRDILSGFLIECTSQNTSPRRNASSEKRISSLLRVIVALEQMSDECFHISAILEKSVRKKCPFKNKVIKELIPYVVKVEEFLVYLEKQLDNKATPAQIERAEKLEESIDNRRKKLQKLSRKQIEAGGNVKAELLFIDLVRRIERLGDYCFEISAAYK